MEDYHRQMGEALDRSEKWGLKTGLDGELLRLYLKRGQPAGVMVTRDHLIEFSRTDVIPFEERAGHCLQVHMSVAEHLLQSGFAAPPVLTIGDVAIDGNRRYNVTRQGLRSLMRDGRRGTGTIHVHAWLTFPDMTILDMSVLPALLMEKGEPLTRTHADGLAVAGQPGSIQYSYSPMLIGMEFVWHTASMVPDETRVRAVVREWRAAGGLDSLRGRYAPDWQPGR